MLFSHISDTHLGLVQYNSEEREKDIYDAFNQAIDVSIKDHVDFVIFAGDLFHTPNPTGTAIMHMAHGLKKLRKNNISSFFILGEHDISRIRSYPVPYVYHKLEFSNYIGQGNPFLFKGVMIAGFDKIRKSEMVNFENKFQELDKVAKKHKGHKILVMHQGITEVNKFAAELNSSDLPKNFSYYAMGHLHDKFLKSFNHLRGPLAYPGSIELTTSEGIKDSKKGFFEVDISTQEAKPEWIEIKTRPQFSADLHQDELSNSIEKIIEKFRDCQKKPIVELRIRSENIQTELIQAQMSRLIPCCLHCSWKIRGPETESGFFMEKPSKIDDELLKLSISSLKSEKLANFAINELLPLIVVNNIEQASQLIMEKYKQFKKEKPK